ncbi:hypothetical protein IAF22_20240, partial [Acinetobacter baumannii]|nr:hypothetical protein [Acinetobacter baumannii]
MFCAFSLSACIFSKVSNISVKTGSYSTKIQIQSVTDTQIYISGNPTKFLQGHNLFGSNDLVGLM